MAVVATSAAGRAVMAMNVAVATNAAAGASRAIVQGTAMLGESHAATKGGETRLVVRNRDRSRDRNRAENSRERPMRRLAQIGRAAPTAWPKATSQRPWQWPLRQ